MPSRITNAANLRILVEQVTQRRNRNVVDVLVTSRTERTAIWRSRMESSDIIRLRDQEVLGPYTVRHIRHPVKEEHKMETNGDITLSEEHPDYGYVLEDISSVPVKRALEPVLSGLGARFGYVRVGDYFVPGSRGEPFDDSAYEDIYIATIKEEDGV